MKSLFALFALFSLLSIASISNARHDPGEYWQSIMKDEAMPEAIQGLIDTGESVSSYSNKKPNCHTSTKEKHFVKDFEPRLNISTHRDDEKLKENKDFFTDFDRTPDVTIYRDFDRTPDVTIYRDFDRTPDATIYRDFDRTPDITIYRD